MNPTLLKITSLCVTILIVFVAYYGSYLPFQKSRAFIKSMRDLGTSASIQDFKKNSSIPLDLKSPIGQEELVQQLASVTLNVVQNTDNPQIIKELVNHLESYYAPIFEGNRSIGLGQSLYVVGSVNELAFLKTQERPYFESAKKYFAKALELGPRRPQSLYGSFDLYRLEGNVEETKKIVDQILTQWPGDEKTRNLLKEFLEQINLKLKSGGNG